MFAVLFILAGVSTLHLFKEWMSVGAYSDDGHKIRSTDTDTIPYCFMMFRDGPFCSVLFRTVPC